MKDENEDQSVQDLLNEINSLAHNYEELDKDEPRNYEEPESNNEDEMSVKEEKSDTNILNSDKSMGNKEETADSLFEDCSSVIIEQEEQKPDKVFNDISSKSNENDNPQQTVKSKLNIEEEKDNYEKSEYKRKFAAFGRELEENLGIKFIQDKNDSISEDYENLQDVSEIKTELNKEFFSIAIRTLITSLCMIFVLVPTVLIRIDDSVPYMLLKENFSIFFIIFCLSALLCCTISSYKIIRSGIVSLLKLQGNCDSAVSFACICSLLQLIVALFSVQHFVLLYALPLYTGIAIMGLFFNLLGKLFIILRIRKNFSFMTSSTQKYSLEIYSNVQKARRMSRSAYNQKTHICYQQKVDFLSDFFKASYAPDTSDYLASSTALFGAGLSILVAISAGLMNQSIFYAVTALALASCVCIPMSAVLTVNMQLWNLCKNTLKRECMVSGFWAVRHFSDVDSIVVDAAGFYPKGSIILKGIKTFDENRIDKALLGAAALIIKINSPLKHVFDEIIQGRKNLLPIVENVEYIDGKGVVGWFGENRMLLGNRELLESFMVKPPTKYFEEKYKPNGYDITYFASSGKVLAAFILKYSPDINTMREMKRLEYDGISVLVRTVDPNLTAEKIANDFDGYVKNIKILPIDLSQEFEEYMVKSEDKSRAYIASTGKTNAVIRAISGCVRIKNNIGLSIAIQVVAMIIGFTLATLLIFYSKLEQAGCPELIIFVLFWVAAVLIAPRIRKP